MKIKDKDGKIIESPFNIKITKGKEIIDLNSIGNIFEEEESD